MSIKTLCFFVQATSALAIFASGHAVPQPGHLVLSRRFPNKVAGTWLLASANATVNGTTFPALGPEPEGILIFAPTLYFSELISIDPSTLPRFSSNSNRSSGTCEEDAAVLAGTLGSYGTYTVDEEGSFKTDTFLGSTFPNYIGMHGNSSTINETLIDHERYLHESLHNVGSDVRIDVLWKRVEDW
jgi:hypothetical protein